MSYPFDNNPLDSYLLSLRALQEREFHLRVKLFEIRGMRQNAQEVFQLLNLVNKQLLDFRSSDPIEPRAFEVFLSDREKKIQAFHQQNPKPQVQVCLHTYTELRREHQRNGSLHIVTQCLTCGTNLRRHSKDRFPNWQSLPEADVTLSKAYHLAINEWHREKQALLDQFPAYSDRPEFDAAQFKERYLKVQPMPIESSECPHETTELTLRTYNNGTLAAVNQCISCGHHFSTISQSGLNIYQLPSFNEDKCLQMKKAYSMWLSTYVDEMRAAMLKFNEETHQKIASGQVTVIDHTTYGTYYSSQEWANARTRIMKRDGYRCQVQACTNRSECVHHISYNRLGCENDLDLISLCNRCHTSVHRKQGASPFDLRLTSCEIRDLKIH